MLAGRSADMSQCPHEDGGAKCQSAEPLVMFPIFAHRGATAEAESVSAETHTEFAHRNWERSPNPKPGCATETVHGLNSAKKFTQPEQACKYSKSNSPETHHVVPEYMMRKKVRSPFSP